MITERLDLRKVILIVALAMVFYFAMVVLSDSAEVGSAFESFRWSYLGPIMALVVFNYLVRAERWHSYLTAIGLRMPRARSYWMFLAGLSMSITPAKAGEAMKALLLKEEKAAPLERGIAVVFAERLSDMIGMVVLIGVGSIAMAYSVVSFIVIMLVLVFVLVLLSRKRHVTWFVIKLKRHRHLARVGDMVGRAAHDARLLLTGRPLLEGSVMSVVAWSAECMAFYIIIAGVANEVSVLESVFIYSFSSVVGAISMMPGGMGTTEATMVGLLVLLSVAAPTASFAVILTRVCTLWFAVAIGIAFLLLRAHMQPSCLRISG